MLTNILKRFYLNINYLNELKKRKIAVMGLGRRTGVSVSNFCFQNGIPYLIIDDSERENLKQNIDMLSDKNPEIYTGKKYPDLSKDTIIILNPGVPTYHPYIINAVKNNHSVIGDIELFYRLYPNITYIAITGTDGKTTTTNLTYKILSTQFKTVMGGNVGIPIMNHFNKIDDSKTYAVLEMSSYQLESIELFKPKIAMLLNLSYDHLNRYENKMELYFNAKKRIYINQDKNDYLILNYDNEYTRNINPKNTNSVKFSTKVSRADFFLQDNTIIYENKITADISHSKLKGIHNRENILAAAAAGYFLGISRENIEKAINNFQSLEHRDEYITEINGIKFFNDSKATTINSVEKAIISHKSGMQLIMGGRDKNLPFDTIKDLIHKKVKNLFLIGEASGKINNQVCHPNTFLCETLKEAVELSFKYADEESEILFSPGCQSFDMFRDYEERGNVFKNIVAELKELINLD